MISMKGNAKWIILLYREQWRDFAASENKKARIIYPKGTPFTSFHGYSVLSQVGLSKKFFFFSTVQRLL